MSDSAASPDTDASGDGGADQTSRTNVFEWTVFALGVAITLGVIGYLGVQIAVGSDEPAALQVTLQAQPAGVPGTTVLIPVEVENTGDRVAEEAVIEVCAGPDSCGTVSFAYIPKGSKRNGMVGLHAPLAAPVDSRVVSYRSM